MYQIFWVLQNTTYDSKLARQADDENIATQPRWIINHCAHQIVTSYLMICFLINGNSSLAARSPPSDTVLNNWTNEVTVHSSYACIFRNLSLRDETTRRFRWIRPQHANTFAPCTFNSAKYAASVFHDMRRPPTISQIILRCDRLLSNALK